MWPGSSDGSVMAQKERDDELDGVQLLEEQEWFASLGFPQLGHVGGGGKLLCMIPMVADQSRRDSGLRQELRLKRGDRFDTRGQKQRLGKKLKWSKAM